MTRITKLGLLVAAIALSGTAQAQVDPLDGVAVQQARAQAPDAAPVGNLYRGMGKQTDYQVLLEAGKCYWFSGASEGLKKLYMYLWQPGAGAFTPRVADLRSPGQGTMAYCSTVPGMYRFQVKTEGKGHYVVAVYSKKAPEQAAPVATPVSMPAAPDLGPLCDKTARAASSQAHRVGELFDGHGSSIGHDDRTDYTVMLEAGKCYWIVGCGEPEKVKSLYMYLWGPDNKRVTEAKSDTANPMVGTCPTVNGMYKVQAKINSGKGAWKVGVYTK